jgi:ribosomal protein L7Ae-like RNA K-turn-binding protein
MSMDAPLQRKLLGLLGLGARGRLVVVGVNQVRDAAMRGTLVLAVVAPDVSRHSLDKVVPLLRAKRVMMLEGPSGAQLGSAVGRNTTAVVGVVDRQLAKGIRALVETGPDRGRE